MEKPKLYIMNNDEANKFIINNQYEALQMNLGQNKAHYAQLKLGITEQNNAKQTEIVIKISDTNKIK